MLKKNDDEDKNYHETRVIGKYFSSIGILLIKETNRAPSVVCFIVKFMFLRRRTDINITS
jgi:hypothetical protein